MKKTNIIIAIIVLLAVLVASFLFWSSKSQVANIQSYEECVKAGFPILETYPEQCKTPDNRTFVKSVATTPTPNPDGTPTSKENLIIVNTPTQNEVIQSPVVVTGKARGYWFFEASFPIKVVDSNGKTIGSGIAQAVGDWMTEDFVSFTSTVTFSNPTTDQGKIILEKDNPSGLPENDDKLEIPVTFSKSTAQKNISLYYYDDTKDKDLNGNILCSSKGLVEVQRSIPITMTPIQDALKLLIKGELTNLERAKGIETEFPLDGLSLVSASLNGGTLTLTWNDPQNKTSGGACRIGILKSQIEATAKQFPEIKSVKMMPAETFQP